MRGDRPDSIELSGPGGGATPHARGSTQLFALQSLCGQGYPACAGIDLTSLHMDDIMTRLPRMRGDRPSEQAPHRIPGWATPHARGSTSAFGPRSLLSYGYPACAGIDLKFR